MKLILAGAVGLAAGVFMWGCFVPALRSLRHGFPNYYVAARLVWEGRWTPRVYDTDWYIAEVQSRTPNQIGEVYAPHPPAMSLLMLPLAGFNISTARQIWLWINLGLFAGALALLAAGMPAGRLGPRVALAVGAMLATPVHENFRLGQAYVLLLFCFALTFWQMQRGRELAAGVPLGLAAAAKLSGGPLWLILAARGHWKTLGSAALFGLSMVGLSLAYAGWAGWQRFVVSLLEHTGELGWMAATAFQTVPSFFQHLFRPDPVWNPQPLWVLPAWVARLCTLAASAVGLVSLWWRAHSADINLSFAAAMVLGVVLLPIAEEYHYALLILPFAAALGHLARDLRRVTVLAVVWLAAAALLVAMPFDYKHLWFFDGWHALLAYPRLYGGWLLWGWLMWATAEGADGTNKQAPGRQP